MDRRSFFKKVGMALAGVFALPSKVKGNKPSLKCGGQNGTLCPRCKYNEAPLTWPLGCKSFREELEKIRIMQAQRTRLEFNCGEIPSLLESRVNIEKYEILCQKYTKENRDRHT